MCPSPAIDGYLQVPKSSFLAMLKGRGIILQSSTDGSAGPVIKGYRRVFTGYHVEVLLDVEMLPQRYPFTLIGYQIRLPRVSVKQLYWDAHFTLKGILNQSVFILFQSVFGEVNGKGELLTATNSWALSQSMKKKVDVEAQRY